MGGEDIGSGSVGPSNEEGYYEGKGIIGFLVERVCLKGGLWRRRTERRGVEGYV